MRKRYLALYRPGGLLDHDRSRLDALLADHALRCCYDDAALLIVADPALPIHADTTGVILGTLHDRGSPTPRITLSAEEQYAIAVSAGLELARNFWGDYVALLAPDPHHLAIVRAPFGDLGCLHLFDGDLWLIASDAALLRYVSRRSITIDRGAVARSLGRGDLMTAETCLGGVDEVRGGTRHDLACTGTWVLSALWSPWPFARHPVDDPGTAHRALRKAIRCAVSAAVSGHDPVLVMLSGGLDSSIVTAAVAALPVTAQSITLFPGDAAGDERDYARLVARHCGVALEERTLDAASVDVMASSAASLPRPASRSFFQAVEHGIAAAAATHGARVIVDGGGGDNLFCSHRSVAAVADSLLTADFGKKLWSTAVSLADLAETSVPKVLAHAIRRAWFRPRGVTPPIDTSLLSADALSMARAQLDHPWLTAPSDALPGKALHIWLLAVAQALVESSYPPEGPLRVSPLMSQPVAEACLRIPSALWFAPGHNRAAARAAFAADLPAETINRRSKALPNHFATILIERYRAQFRAMLLDGYLAQSGLIDVEAVRVSLDDHAPARSYDFTRLLRLGDVEAWARHWS